MVLVFGLEYFIFFFLSFVILGFFEVFCCSCESFNEEEMNQKTVHNDDYPFHIVSYEFEEWVNNRHLYVGNQEAPEQVQQYRAYAQAQGQNFEIDAPPNANPEGGLRADLSSSLRLA